MSTEPTRTPVTSPVAVTDATVASDVRHVASDVTIAELSAAPANALNCAELPTVGGVPTMVRFVVGFVTPEPDVEVGDVVDGVEEEQADDTAATRLRTAARLSTCYLMIACITAFSNPGRISRTGVW